MHWSRAVRHGHAVLANPQNSDFAQSIPTSKGQFTAVFQYCEQWTNADTSELCRSHPKIVHSNIRTKKDGGTNKR